MVGHCGTGLSPISEKEQDTYMALVILPPQVLEGRGL